MQPNTQLTDDRILTIEYPPVPGLNFRRHRGPADYPLMLAVIAGSKDEDGIERVDSLEDITRNYSHLDNCDPFQDMIFAEVDGQVVGYSRVTWWTETSGAWVYLHFGFLLPAYRNQGIGSAMLAWSQQRLLAIAAEHLASGKRPADAPAYFEGFASDTEKAARRLLEDNGFSIVRSGYQMVRPDLENIPDLPLPDGVEIRPVDWPAQARQIWEAEIEAFRDHWGFSEPEEKDFHDWVDEVNTDSDLDPSLWRVAWHGDQVAGMVRSFILRDENEGYNRLRGYTEHISTRRPWRRQGVARALIAHSLRALKERGMQHAALGVDTQNTSGATRVYEAMGFRPVRISYTYRKPLP